MTSFSTSYLNPWPVASIRDTAFKTWLLCVKLLPLLLQLIQDRPKKLDLFECW